MNKLTLLILCLSLFHVELNMEFQKELVTVLVEGASQCRWSYNAQSNK